MKKIHTFADNISMAGKSLKMITDRRGCLKFMDEGYPVEIPKGYSKEESIEIMELMVEEYSKNLKECSIEK